MDELTWWGKPTSKYRLYLIVFLQKRFGGIEKIRRLADTPEFSTEKEAKVWFRNWAIKNKEGLEQAIRRIVANHFPEATFESGRFYGHYTNPDRLLQPGYNEINIHYYNEETGNIYIEVVLDRELDNGFLVKRGGTTTD